MIHPVIVPATRQLSEAHYSTIPGDSEVRLNPGVLLAEGNLEIVCEIGRGGIAVVYRAIDHTRGEEVAIKVGTAQAEGRRMPLRFRNEHRIGLMLGTHEQIVRPLRVGMLSAPAGFEGCMYLVTELVQGQPLDIVMAMHRHGLDVHRACTIGRDIAQALVAMHGQGIVHRDIKPGNVLVSGDGAEKARLIDFGLAYVRGDDWAEPSHGETRVASVSGTALYMAPEQALGHCPAPAADIYALGAMLYEIFSGNPPHDRLPHAELMARKCDRARSPISISRMCVGLDPRLTEIIDQCLSYEPSERPTASEIAAAVGECLTTKPPQPSDERRSIGGLLGLVVFLSAISAVAMTTVVLLLLAWPDDRPLMVEPSTPPSPERPSAWSSGALVNPPSSAADLAAAGTNPAPPGKASVADKGTSKSAGNQRSGRARQGSSSRKADGCSATVTKAKRAAVRRQWGRVLRITRNPECWTGTAASLRALLRTQSYFETGRDSDCVRSGRGLTDPQAVRWVRVCEAKSKENLQ